MNFNYNILDEIVYDFYEFQLYLINICRSLQYFGQDPPQYKIFYFSLLTCV